MADKKPKPSQRRSAKGKAVPSEHLRSDESAFVLEKLLAAHPELQKEVNAQALELAKASAFEVTAEWLAENLRSLDLDELNDRAGDHGMGYVDPGDAGYEACQEVLDPLLEEMDRQVDLGLEADALETLKGIVLGLYLARKDQGDACLAWAGDFPSDAAELAVARWQDELSRAPSPGNRTRKSRSTFLEFVTEHAPEWTEDLGRLLARRERPRP